MVAELKQGSLDIAGILHGKGEEERVMEAPQRMVTFRVSEEVYRALLWKKLQRLEAGEQKVTLLSVITEELEPLVEEYRQAPRDGR